MQKRSSLTLARL